MNPERPEGLSDVRFFVTREDGTQELLGEMQSIQATVTQHTEPYPSLEEVLETQAIHSHHAAAEEAFEQEQPLEAPAAIEEEPSEVSDLEKLLQSFSNVEEGNLYSEEVNRAIEIVAGAETMQQALEQLRENEGMDFKHLLFRQIDQESRELDKFMFELQRIPSLPSMDVDFI